MLALFHVPSDPWQFCFILTKPQETDLKHLTSCMSARFVVTRWWWCNFLRSLEKVGFCALYRSKHLVWISHAAIPIANSLPNHSTCFCNVHGWGIYFSGCGGGGGVVFKDSFQQYSKWNWSDLNASKLDDWNLHKTKNKKIAWKGEYTGDNR